MNKLTSSHELQAKRVGGSRNSVSVDIVSTFECTVGSASRSAGAERSVPFIAVVAVGAKYGINIWILIR